MCRACQLSYDRTAHDDGSVMEGTSLMRWWRFCPFCGQHLELVVYDGK